MTLATLYDFLISLAAELVFALGALVVKKLCDKKTTRDQNHAGTDERLEQ